MVVYRLIEGTYVRGQISGFNLRPSLLALIELDCCNSTVRPSVRPPHFHASASSLHSRYLSDDRPPYSCLPSRS